MDLSSVSDKSARVWPLKFEQTWHTSSRLGLLMRQRSHGGCSVLDDLESLQGGDRQDMSVSEVQWRPPGQILSTRDNVLTRNTHIRVYVEGVIIKHRGSQLHHLIEHK